jgi:hypothetical protein
LKNIRKKNEDSLNPKPSGKKLSSEPVINNDEINTGKLLKEQLIKESKLASENSMKVLKGFEHLNDLN